MKIFRFVKKDFFVRLTNLSFIYFSMNNQECKIRSQVVTVNEEESVFFPFSIKTSKCRGNCNNINYPYAKICVPDVKKN